MAPAPAPPFQLCFLLTRAQCRRPPLETLEAAVAGGADCVQLREKEASARELWEWGQTLREACRRLAVPLIVNDSVELAAALRADGVHLGQDDLHPDDARLLLGPGPWIGWSTHDLEQLDEAADLEVDYAAFGPIFASETKGYAQGCGPETLAAALAIARLPVIAIGGIRPESCWMIPDSCGLAAASALAAASDPQAAAAALRARRPPRQSC